MLLVRHLMTIDFQKADFSAVVGPSLGWQRSATIPASPSLRWMSSSKRSTSHPRSAGCATVIDGQWMPSVSLWITKPVLRFGTGLHPSLEKHGVTMCYHVTWCYRIVCSRNRPQNWMWICTEESTDSGAFTHLNPKNMRRYEHVWTKHKQTNVQSPSETHPRIGKGHTATPSTPDAATWGCHQWCHTCRIAVGCADAWRVGGVVQIFTCIPCGSKMGLP